MAPARLATAEIRQRSANGCVTPDKHGHWPGGKVSVRGRSVVREISMRFSSSAVIGSIVGALLMGVSLLFAPPGSAATAPVAGAHQVTAPAPRTPRGLPSAI